MKTMQIQPQIRALTPRDDLVRLTQLIHAAYAPHAAGGLRFWGTHQTVEDTTKRFAAGFGFVAEADGQYVGTVTVRPPQPESPVTLYRGAWSIAQFAVDPVCKGLGVGRLLHDVATAHAVANGAPVMAMDTAAPAIGLITMYKAWGYELVGEHSWTHTNYVSVLMQRSLVGGLARRMP